MDRRLRPAFDSLDFTQMVWAAFFQNNAALPTFREPHDLFCYLAALARNKVVDMHRHQFRARRSSGAPAMSLEQLPEHDRAQPLRAPDPTPSQLASAREQWTHLMLRQSERDRRIVRLRAEGATLQDISQQVGIHERTVRKVLKRFRRSLDRESHQLT
jgi:RNA polymerase sigma factor (sigma-70 family)